MIRKEVTRLVGLIFDGKEVDSNREALNALMNEKNIPVMAGENKSAMDEYNGAIGGCKISRAYIRAHDYIVDAVHVL